MAKELSEMSIYERIDAAYAEISQAKIVKDGSVSTGGRSGYSYVKIAQILDVVRKAHGRYGIKVFFGRPVYDATQGEKRYAEVRKGQYGDTKWQVANGHIDVRIIGRDEEDVIEVTVPFEAQDNSDKLTSRIITNAERCLYRVLYAIDEGEGSDPEAVNVTNMVENHPEPKKVDPFFAKKDPQEPAPLLEERPSGPYAHTHTNAVNTEAEKTKEGEKVDPGAEALKAAEPMTPRQKQEMAYSPSKIPDSIYRPAIALAKRYIYTHPMDKDVIAQIKRMGTPDVTKWPKAHVVDLANLTLEEEGKEPLPYHPTEGSA